MNQTTWLIERTVRFSELTITPNAVLIAPEGKTVTLVVNGVSHDIVPGTYYGDVVLNVAEVYHVAPHSLMRMSNVSRDFAAALVVDENGAQVRIPDMFQGGSVDDHGVEGTCLATTEQSFNGIVLHGNADYTIRDSEFAFEGFADNDFLGVGAAITAIDHAKLQVERCKFYFDGVTRCAIHVGGRSDVVVRDSEIINWSPNSDWVGDFSWQLALLGTCRLVQLCDGAKVTYDHCRMLTNGWGICSIDGTDAPVTLHIKDCDLRLTGPRSHGYGAFCIGGNTVILEDSRVEVNGYPMLVQGKNRLGRPIIRRSTLLGRRFGAMVFRDTNSVFDIEDSTFRTGKSSMVVKGSATVIRVKNTQFQPGNGVILQMMDNDECGMTSKNFVIPVGELDQPIPGRNLFAATEEDDVLLTLSDLTATGDFFNSTTNLHAEDRSRIGGRGTFHDTMAGLPDFGGSGGPGGPGGPSGLPPKPVNKDLSGPRNLGLSLKNARVTGIISAAHQFYRDGLKEITPENRIELSNITQKAAPAVNNGVIVTLDGQSTWTVTGTSYLTALTLEEGAVVQAPQGQHLTATLNGQPLELNPGSYQGEIVLTPEA